MIYLAVEGYKRTKNALIIVLPVMVFILCGFEHCVANMFYLAYAGRLFTPAGLWFLLLNIIGNSAGGIGMNFIATWAPVKK
jgi:formate/nitrite transporter FocA (FNT family)